MLRNEFSYWLTVAATANGFGPDGDASADEVSRAIETATDLVESERTKSELRFAVDPDVGTLEEVADMSDRIRDLSKKYPTLTFSIRELDETDKSRQHALRVLNGETIYEGNARVVEADTAWDDVTVKAVVDAIKNDFHQNELAVFIAARFRNTPWRY